MKVMALFPRRDGAADGSAGVGSVDIQEAADVEMAVGGETEELLFCRLLRLTMERTFASFGRFNLLFFKAADVSTIASSDCIPSLQPRLGLPTAAAVPLTLSPELESEMNRVLRTATSNRGNKGRHGYELADTCCICAKKKHVVKKKMVL